MKHSAAISTLVAIFGINAMAIWASTAAAAPLLPDAVSYEFFGLSFAEYDQTSTVVGTLDYSGQPGCAGVCTATTQLGTSPTVSVNASEMVYQNSSGGVIQSSLGYYIEYLNTPGTYAVDLHSVANLAIPDGTTSASAALTFGPAGSNTASLNNFSSVTLQEADCVLGCPPPGFVSTTGPFATDQQVAMVANTPYFVQLDLLFRPQPSGVQFTGMVDPTFSTSSGGQFIFSPGVLSAVPEPAAWLSMMVGLAAITTYRRNRSTE